MALISLDFDRFIKLENRFKLQTFYTESPKLIGVYMFLEAQIFSTSITMKEIQERFGKSEYTVELFKSTYLRDGIKIESIEQAKMEKQVIQKLDTGDLKELLNNFINDFSKLTVASSGGEGTAGQALIPVQMGSGEILRCMSCGQIILSGETACPACGSEKLSNKDVELSLEKWVGFEFQSDVKWIIEFLEKYTLSQITDITEKQKKSIKNILIDSMKEGWTLNKLEDKIENIVDDKNKAKMIARTETIRAANEGALLRYNENDIEKVKWLAVPSAPGGRTCDRCLARNGKEYLLKDAKGQIPLHVYCRCTFAPLVE